MLLDVACKEKKPIEPFKRSFESTQKKQHFDANITCIEESFKKVMAMINVTIIVLPYPL